jgi:DNA-binding transcriptional LysR family regulator
MELRHLRYFLAVAEELRFARAAEKLHIEQSPLSRAIKELEEELGVALFARTTRSTRLTHAGTLFLEHVRRVFAALEQARDSVKAAANGFHGQLRVAMSDGITRRACRPYWRCVVRKNPRSKFASSRCRYHSRSKGFMMICTTWGLPNPTK